jgi:hypothetical protein
MRQVSCGSMMPAIVIYVFSIYCLLFIHLFNAYITYLFCSTCSGSMREVSCGNTMPAIKIILFIYLLLSISYDLVPAAGACARHPAAA